MKAFHFLDMSEEQLRAFLEAVKADAGLQEKLKGAGDLDAALVIAKEAGYEVSKAQWLEAQDSQSSSSQMMEMSDEELAGVTGGNDVLVLEKRFIVISR